MGRVGKITLPVEQGAGGHVKVLDLADILDIEEAFAFGLIFFLWDWASQYAEDGCVGKAFESVRKVKHVFRTEIFTPEQLKDAFIRAGLLEERDDCLYIHDWREHGIGAALYKQAERRAKDRERQKQKKSGNKGEEDQRDSSNIYPPPEKAPESPKSPQKRPQKKQEADPLEVIRYWNRLAEKYKLRKTKPIPTLKNTRQLSQKIKSKHMTMEQWIEYLETITLAPYTRPGQGGDDVKDWVADLTWALENKTFRKYEAGTFDRWKPPGWRPGSILEDTEPQGEEPSTGKAIDSLFAELEDKEE